MNINKAILTGRITADPELKYIPNTQTPVCDLNIAVNRKPAKDKKEVADFFRVITWGKLAEAVCRYTKRGREIALSGRLQSRSYEKNGEKRVTVEIVADEVEFLGPNKNESQSSKSIENQHQTDSDFTELPYDADIPF